MLTRFTVSACAAALACVAAFAPVAASAAPKFTYNGPATGGFINVNADRSGAGGSNETFQSGPFDMTQTDPGTPLGDFIAWCFELDQNLVTSGTGTRSYTSGNVLDADQRKRVQSVFDANYKDAAIETNRRKGAAFQLALWEVIYDDNFDLGGGDFKSSTGGNVRSLADGFLTEANAYTGPQQWVLTELSSDTAQDLGTVNAIPLPAAAWLLLGVTGGLVAAKRRSARREA